MNDKKFPGQGFEKSLQAVAAAVALAGNKQAPELASVPEDRVREQRIAELRKLYQSGEYKADALAITARIIDEHLT
jgi:anti-sigma28 factor (negative regulator of flagellin synthesis)